MTARRRPAPFAAPVLVTRPLLPDLDRFRQALGPVWDSRWLTNAGVQHQCLEAALRRELGVAHLSLFTSGTIALLVACRALRLDGEVLTTPFTFPATPHALTWSGLDPVFCDVDAATMTLDPAEAEARLTPRTSAILAVHVYGTPCDVAGLQAVADRHGLKLIYDAAHSFGVEIDGVPIGAFGDLSAYSFHATKLFHTAEGGGIACRDGQLAAEIELLRNFGIAGEEEVALPGINGKMSEIQAVLGLLVLESLADERARRAEVAAVYREQLAEVEGIALAGAHASVRQSLQYFVVRVDETAFGCSRDLLQARLREYNVFARKYFFPLCSEYPHYRELPSAAVAGLPRAHRAAREVLCLPLHGGLGPADARRIAAMVRHEHEVAVAADAPAPGGYST